MGIKGIPIGWVVVFLFVANLAAATDSRLVDAVKEGDHAAVRSLLREHADVNAPQGYGETVMAWAANRNDLEMVEILIGAGGDVNAEDVYGITPLSLACTNGNATLVERILAAGANPNAAQATGETPLMTCTRTGSVEAVKALLELGADVNAKDGERGQTALMWAAAQKHPEVVEVLIEQGAELDARSAILPLYTPKMINKSSGALIEFYSKNVYFPKVKGGFTPLMFAGQAGALDSARILLAAGAEVNAATPDDGSALVLNTATAINLAFTARQRRLELKEGELLLSAASDPLTPERPLVISTREGLIETRNARLSVQQRARDTRVAVFSGTALLHGAGLAQQVELNAGQQRQLSLGAISAPTPANEQSLLWQQGMLLAIDMPLGTLTEELGRYRSGVVRCDPAVAAIVVSGAFSLRDTDASLALLQKTLPVRVHQLGPWWVTIKPA